MKPRPEQVAPASEQTSRDAWESEAPSIRLPERLESLEHWRIALFDRLTVYSFWASLVIGLAIGFQEFIAGEWAVAPLTVVSVPFFGIAAWLRSWDRRARALLYLIVIWGACGGTLLGAGFWVAPPFVAIVSVAVILTLSVGPAAGWTTIGGFVLILVGLAVHFVGGGQPTSVERFQLDLASNWARVITVYAVVASLSIAAINFLVSKLSSSQEHNEQLFLALREEDAHKLATLRREQEMVGRLQDSQKLEGLGRLAGGISHDFNNLLTVMIGNANLLRDTRPDAAEVELDAIIHAGERASELAQRLLTFSRNQPVSHEAIEFNSALESSMALIGRLIPSSIEVHFKMDKSVGAARISRTELDQLVMNLCLNARDAMDGTGTLTISSTRVTRPRPAISNDASAENETFVLLEVKDSGAGMSPEVQAHLFEPFFTTKSVGQGTGLGLSVVHGVVASHGGFIEIESKLGRGSTFQVYLPAADLADVGTASNSLRPSAGSLKGSETVLIVDDNEQVLEVTKKVMSAAGYRVLACATGGEAFSLYKEEAATVKLLITDAVMPNMSGRELYERIHALDPKLPVLFCSGYDSGTLSIEFFKEPKRALLAKPFDDQNLLKIARGLLDE